MQSTPGKVILFGEHSVVYYRPAIAAPVSDVRTYAQAEEYNKNTIEIKGEIMNKTHPLYKSLVETQEFLGKTNPLKISIMPELPVASGMGSGASVSAAIIKSVYEYYDKEMNLEEINNLCYETEKIFHGTPSGIDNTIVVYEKPIYYIKGEPIQFIQVKKPFKIIIGSTGIKAPTKEIVSGVRERRKKNKEEYEQIFDEITKITEKAKKIIEEGEVKKLSGLMTRNQVLLEQMGVSHPKLEEFIQIAMDNGALGAKLTGAGGGGNMICMVEGDEEKVCTALKKAGAKNTFVTEIK